MSKRTFGIKLVGNEGVELRDGGSVSESLSTSESEFQSDDSHDKRRKRSHKRSRHRREHGSRRRHKHKHTEDNNGEPDSGDRKRRKHKRRHHRQREGEGVERVADDEKKADLSKPSLVRDRERRTDLGMDWMTINKSNRKPNNEGDAEDCESMHEALYLLVL